MKSSVMWYHIMIKSCNQNYPNHYAIPTLVPFNT